MLSACSSLKVTAEAEPLPLLDSKYENCFSEHSRYALPKGPWGKADVQVIIANLRKSEKDIGKCGRDLISFYEDLSHSLSAKD